MTGFSCASQPEKRKRPSRFCACGRDRPVAALGAVEHAAALVELDLVLREVGGHDAVAEAHRARRPRSRRPSTVSSSVVLPEPFGPTSPTCSPRSSAKVASVSSSLVAGGDARAPSASTTVRPLRGGLRKSKPSERLLRGQQLELAARVRRAPSRGARSASASPAPAWPCSSCSGTARRSARAARCRRRRAPRSWPRGRRAPPSRAARRATARGRRASGRPRARARRS